MNTIRFMLLFCATTFLVVAGENPQNQRKVNQSLAYQWKHYDGNRINASINNAGPYADYLEKNISGLEWPKGSGKTAVFTAGMWIIGKHRPTDSLRTAVMSYSTEYQPGPVLTTFNTTTNDPSVAANPNDLKYRVYKINRGDNASTNADYAEWPGDLGAPFIDNNNNGVWDPGIDSPKLFGDQTLWCVFNDVSPAYRYGVTRPMGIEVQATYFGYDTIEWLRDIMFIRWRIINKSDAAYDSIYIGMWADIDMGDANDDLVGSDPFFDLNYTYNGDNNDASSSGYGLKPPACGFMFLQGPIVPGKPEDSARFGNRFLHGFKNLRSTSSIAILKNYSPFQDPPLGIATFAQHAHNFMRGVDANGSPIINPHTKDTTTFMFDGDPVSGTGWLQTDLITPRDNRSIISSGPFTLAQSDTQEVIGAFVIAQGTDRLNSITELREAARTAKQVHSLHYPVLPIITIDTVDVTDSTVTLRCNAALEEIPALYGKIYVYSPDTLGYLSKYFLYDNGTEGDVTAGDKVYTTVMNLPKLKMPYTVDLALYGNGTDSRWNKIFKFSSVKVSPISVVIHSDNINHDGAVNAGETVRFGVILKNFSNYEMENILVTAKVNSTSNTLRFASVPANSAIASVYNQNDPSSYLSFTLPVSYEKETYTVPLVLTDSLGNHWEATLVFPVTKINNNVPIVHQTQGKGKAKFDIIITDQSKIKNHDYTIFGIDSVGRPSLVMFGIKDSSANILLAERIPATPSTSQLPSLPEYDGFKILVSSAQTQLKLDETYSNTIQPWFQSFSFIDSTTTISTIHYGDVPDIRFKFSSKLAYNDLNSNGRYDVGEPYTVDSLNTDRSQYAYFYRRESGLAASMHYVGFRPVPFAVFDISGNTESKLSVVINDRDKNFQWDVVAQNSASVNSVYVLKDSYDPTGTQYDSSKGGTDLSAQLRTNSGLPIYYRIDFYSVTGNEPYSSAVDFTVRNSHPFSSRDKFIFNPTVLTGVHNKNLFPVTYALDQNYPNPFNPATTIRYSLPQPSNVNLSVYNILGQRIATLVNEVNDAGIHSVVWNGKSDAGFSVASGIYFYHITAGSFSAVKKMLLVK